MNDENRIVTVADTFAGLIAADPFFTTAPLVPVMTERKGDINATIAQALGKIGMGVCVVAPDGDDVVASGDRLKLRVRIVAEISELVLANQAACKSAGIAYRPALAAVARIMKAVSLKPNGLDGLQMHRPRINEFNLDPQVPFRLVPDKRCVVYHVNATTTIDL